ncbi:uncharacterized protein LOC112135491 [Pongo abelii]|uniref:uncharacterized protein LOC112135491 n=1 Tax=Pongo abelii TaxID=9601 RepID=UPI0023E805A8|nr:uncharacterized protein LOC112135491 [Pongo abelii]XP_054380604.1 uncharacterized protein LOC112135491 [Pongo abelii]XP_054380605.1 uncharacterized protein LOC112135491 [Pongo abelii]
METGSRKSDFHQLPDWQEVLRDLLPSASESMSLKFWLVLLPWGDLAGPHQEEEGCVPTALCTRNYKSSKYCPIYPFLSPTLQLEQEGPLPGNADDNSCLQGPFLR